MKYLFAFYCVAAIQAADLVPTNFIAAVRQVESGGKPGPVYGDFVDGKPKAIGPLQIHLACWQDATKFDKSIGGSYTNCQDCNYSIKIFNAYMARYKSKHNYNLNKMSQLWNQGPGFKYNTNNSYWLKVKKNL